MRTGCPVAKIESSAEVAGILEGYTQRRRKTAQRGDSVGIVAQRCEIGGTRRTFSSERKLLHELDGRAMGHTLGTFDLRPLEQPDRAQPLPGGHQARVSQKDRS